MRQIIPWRVVAGACLAGGVVPDAAEQDAQDQQLSPPLSSILQFVTDPGRNEAPLAAAAKDSYGGGRQLLLPLFRGLQARAAARLARSGCGATSGRRQQRHAAGSAVHAQGAAACEAAEGDDSKPSGGSSARYYIGADEAVRLAQETADAWRRDRAAHLGAGSSAGPAEGAAAAHAGEGAPGTAQRSVSEALRRAARPLKRGVVVWDAPPDLQHDRVEEALAAEAARSDTEAARQLQQLREAPAYLSPHAREPPDLEAGGRVYPAAKSGGEAGAATQRMQDATAVVAWQADEREGLAFSRAAAAVRAERVKRGLHAPVVEAAAAGPAMQQVRAAALHGGRCGARVAAVAEGLAPFAAEAPDADGAPRMCSFRLLALARQQERSAAGGFAGHGAGALQHSSEDGSLHGKASASEGAGPSRSAACSTASESASAERLGLWPGGGSALLEAAAGPLPRIPDLIRLLGAALDDDALAEEPELARAAAAPDGESERPAAGAAHAEAGQGSEEPVRQRPPGTAWRDGLHMTIPMTTLYEIDPLTGQVTGKSVRAGSTLPPCMQSPCHPCLICGAWCNLGCHACAGGPCDHALERLHRPGAGRLAGCARHLHAPDQAAGPHGPPGLPGRHAAGGHAPGAHGAGADCAQSDRMIRACNFVECECGWRRLLQPPPGLKRQVCAARQGGGHHNTARANSGLGLFLKSSRTDYCGEP